MDGYVWRMYDEWNKFDLCKKRNFIKICMRCLADKKIAFQTTNFPALIKLLHFFFLISFFSTASDIKSFILAQLKKSV